MQAYSPVLPVGAQHHYKSGFDALKTIFKAEGVRGMFRGIDAAILRTGMGSSVRTCAPLSRSLLSPDRALETDAVSRVVCAGPTPFVLLHQERTRQQRHLGRRQCLDLLYLVERLWYLRLRESFTFFSSSPVDAL